MESQELPSWSDVKDHFTKTFPAVEPEFIEKYYNQALKLRKAREQYQERNPLHEEYGEFVVPGIVPGMESYEYSRARKRYAGGDADGADFAVMARHERADEIRGTMGKGEQFSRFLGTLPATVAHVAVGGLPLIVAEQTFEHATRRNEELGRHPLDPRVMPTAAAQAMIQALAFKVIGPYGQGIANPATRLVAKSLTGAATQQGLDILAGAVDEVLPEAYKTRTRYGAIGALLRGEAGEAFQKGAMDMLTMAAFQLAHGNPGLARRTIQQFASDPIKFSASKMDQTQRPGFMGQPFQPEPTTPPPPAPPETFREAQERRRRTPVPPPPPEPTPEESASLLQRIIGDSQPEKYHGHSVVYVDPEEMRKTNQDFANVAVTPDGKILVNRDLQGKDLHQVIQEGLRQSQATARGLDPKKAEQEEIGHDHREPKEGSLPADVYAGDLGRTPDGSHQIRIVDGAKVRQHDPTFAEGGNHEALKYVPAGEIWIEKDLAEKHPNEVQPTILHELTEAQAMKGGMKYAEAHQRANLEEFKLRQGQPAMVGGAAPPETQPVKPPEKPATTADLEARHLEAVRELNSARARERQERLNFEAGLRNDLKGARKARSSAEKKVNALERLLDQRRTAAMMKQPTQEPAAQPVKPESIEESKSTVAVTPPQTEAISNMEAATRELVTNLGAPTWTSPRIVAIARAWGVEVGTDDKPKEVIAKILTKYMAELQRRWDAHEDLNTGDLPLTDDEKAVAQAIAEGATFKQAAGFMSSEHNQTAAAVIQRIAEKTNVPNVKERLQQQAVAEPLRGEAEFPERQEPKKKKPPSVIKSLEKALEQATKAVIKETQANGGNLPDERYQHLSSESARLNQLLIRAERGERIPIEQTSFRSQPEPGVQGAPGPSQPAPEETGRQQTRPAPAGALPEAARSLLGGGQESGETYQYKTALANAQVDRERAQRRLPPLMSQARQSNPEAWDKAMSRLARDPEAAKNLVDEINRSPRAVTDVVENALLLHRRIDLRNQYANTVGEYVNSLKSPKDVLNMRELEARERELSEQIEASDKADRISGSEAGRAFQFRRQLAKEDYSLAGMLLRLQAAKKPGLEVTPEEKARLIDLQKRIEAGEQELEQAEKGYAGQGYGSREYRRIQAAEATAERGKREFKQMVAMAQRQSMSWPQYLGNLWLRFRRAELLSGPQTIAKIAAAATERAGLGLAEQSATSIWRQVPLIKEIAALAPRWGGGLSARGEAQSNLDMVTKGVVDSFEKINDWWAGQGGQSQLEKRLGYKGGDSGWLELPGVIHGMLKAPIERAEFTRSVLARIDNARATGQDFSSRAALAKIEIEAFKDAQRSIFMQDNLLVNQYKKALSKFRKSDSPAARATALVADTLLPIVRVPTNIVAEAAEYTAGLPVGLAKAGIAIKNGAKNLSPDQSDIIMRQLSKGSVGGAALALGMFLPDVVGGFYQHEEKRKPGDVPVGGLRTPAGDIKNLWLHHPFFLTMQLGATISRVYDKEAKKQGYAAATPAMLAGMGGLAEEIPFVRQPLEAGKILFSPRDRGYAFGELVKSLVVPQVFQWLARTTDTAEKRRPQTLTEHIASGIPGLRQNVPTPEEVKAQQRRNRQSAR